MSRRAADEPQTATPSPAPLPPPSPSPSPPPLRHTCGGTISTSPAGTSCAGCATAVEVDDLGVVCVAAVDGTWPGVPESVQDDIARASTSDDVIEAMLEASIPWPDHLARQLMHPAGGVAAALVDVAPSAVALDLGTGWSTLPTALASLGATAVSADWVPTRLRFGQLMLEHPPAQAVTVDPADQLPWADDTFDVVFVDLDATVAAAHAPGSRSTAARKHVLAELRRILKPDGVAVIGMRGALHHGRRAVMRNPRLISRAPWNDRALSAAGLIPRRTHVPLPTFPGWERIVSTQAAITEARASYRGRKARLAALLTHVGLAHLLVRDAIVIAGPSHATRPAVAAAAVDQLVGDDAVTLALTDARVAVRGDSEFAKYPLSVSQREAIVAEVDKTRVAADTGFGSFVVTGARIGDLHGVPYSAFPLVDQVPISRDQVERVLERAVRSVTATDARLDATDLWQRLLTPRAVADADEIGAAVLRTAVLERLGAAVVPTGATHGDLHESNVMVTPEGVEYLVDWNRFELNNPLFLDAVYAGVKLHETRAEVGFATALDDFADGKIDGPLAERALELLGDLTVEHAAAIVLLDRVTSYSLPRRRYKPWTLRPFERATARLVARLDRWST